MCSDRDTCIHWLASAPSAQPHCPSHYIYACVSMNMCVYCAMCLNNPVVVLYMNIKYMYGCSVVIHHVLSYLCEGTCGLCLYACVMPTMKWKGGKWLNLKVSVKAKLKRQQLCYRPMQVKCSNSSLISCTDIEGFHQKQRWTLLSIISSNYSHFKNAVREHPVYVPTHKL